MIPRVKFGEIHFGAKFRDLEEKGQAVSRGSSDHQVPPCLGEDLSPPWPQYHAY